MAGVWKESGGKLLEPVSVLHRDLSVISKLAKTAAVGRDKDVKRVFQIINASLQA